jgi:hypothetical protein
MSSSSSSSFKTGIFLFGGLQLILGLISANWAWRLWQTAEVDLPASFWGALALTLFLVGIAQINLVGPFRDRGHQMPVAKIALPYRLEPQFGGRALMWPYLSLAFAFGAPVFPMIRFLLTVEGSMAELKLIWIGLIGMGVIMGGATLFLGVQKLYERIHGSRTVVEVSAKTVKPGESFSLLVQYTPGRLRTEYLRVKWVCRRTETRSAAGSKGKTVETKILYEKELQPASPVHASVFQKTWTVTVPEEAELSTETPGLSLTWEIEIIATLPNAPDITETFVMTVDDPELRARWEAEWEAEAREDHRSSNGT